MSSKITKAHKEKYCSECKKSKVRYLLNGVIRTKNTTGATRIRIPCSDSRHCPYRRGVIVCGEEKSGTSYIPKGETVVNTLNPSWAEIRAKHLDKAKRTGNDNDTAK